MLYQNATMSRERNSREFSACLSAEYGPQTPLLQVSQQNVAATSSSNSASFSSILPLFPSGNESADEVMGLDQSAEKLPVTQKQAVIIVTRTYQEEKAKQRRKTIVASIALILLVAWLIWALYYTM